MSKVYKTLAAIDIGTTKIVAIIGRKDENGKIEILGMGQASSKGVKRGVIQNIDDAVNSISTAVEIAKEKSDIDFDEVYVGIAGQHIKSVRSGGQKYISSADNVIKQEDVDALVDDMYNIPVGAGEEVLHVIPQNYTVDGESDAKPVGMFGRHLEGSFHIVIGQIDSANNLKKCVNRSGLKVVDLILEPLASAHAVLSDEEKEVGVALVDIGGGTTDIAVYYDGIIRHTAVIPFGGNVITSDIKTGFSILEKHAEKLKIMHGSALADAAKENDYVSVEGINGRPPKEISLKSIAYVVQSRMAEIIGAVQFQIDNSGFGEKLGAGIVLTGGGALLNHLPQLVAYETGYDIRIGLPSKYLIGEYSEEINKTMYATSIGLILQGYEFLEKKKKDSLFEIPDKKKKKKVKEIDNKTEKKVRFDGLLRKIGDFFDEKDNPL
ncbi:MAG: cell division protein FtsA [Bacteroidota bacterium]